MSVISPARAGNVPTHAWTKLYTEIMTKFLAFMSAVYAWPPAALPNEATQSTTVHIKFVPPVSGLPSSVEAQTSATCVSTSVVFVLSP